MNMFARFDENPAMTLQVIKETKRYGHTDGRTHGRTDGRTDNVKTVYPLQTKFAGGIMSFRSQTGNCEKGTDWLKRWVEAQHNIYVEKCFVIGQ